MNENILVSVGANISGLQKNLSKATRDITGLGITSAKVMKGMSAESFGMASEMKTAFTKQRESLMGFTDDMVKVKYGFFQMAQGAKEYTGTTGEFMDGVAKMGKAHKTVTESMMNDNELMKMSFFQTVGAMVNKSSQASKISAEFDRIKNPLYSVNKAGLAVADSLSKIAINGNASVLALKRLGPNASMKSLKDMTMQINQGLMRFTGVALIAAFGAAVFYKAMHDGAMKLDKGYAEAFKNMGSSVKKAFEPMVQLFADVMTPVFNLITKVADLVTEFNEAHPVIAKVVAGFGLLLPALTLILAPLAIGIGLFGGLSAAFGFLWLAMSPIVVGFLTMMGTVLLVAAGIALLVAGVMYAYKNFEWFRTAVDATLKFLKTTFMTAFTYIKELVMTVMSEISLFIGEILTKLQAFWSEHGEAIKTLVVGSFNAIWNAIKNVMGYILGIFQMVWPIISGVVKIAWNLIKLGVKNGLDIILGLVGTVMKVLQGDWKGAWNTIKDTAKNIWKNIESFFKSVNLKQIGKDIINGLVKGIGSMAGAVKSAAKSIADSIPQGIKKLLGIHSPSRVLAKLGMYAGMGLANGLDGEAKSVAKSALGLANAAVATPTLSYNTPRGSFGNISKALSGSVDVNNRDSMLIGAINSLEARLTSLTIEMDGRKVGQLVTPHVSNEMALRARLQKRS